MNYLERCKQAIDEIVEQEAKIVQDFVDSEIQPLTWEQLDRLAFDKMLEQVHKLEEEAEIG